ncbi:MAG TPA: leucyl/phenylalanyl-tRNA--protein transferase [Gammaproteobacteria bacterium]|nr:leucyl/phenylalanyl-tRNA--protein transferase [Gammaproteobacteria bacterium]
MPAPYWLDSSDLRYRFPDVNKALSKPDGLLAVGGGLSVGRLVQAYKQGIFPWYSEGQPVLWWSPDPRFVLLPERMHISRSLAKILRQGRYQIRLDSAFRQVIGACASITRNGQNGTWITDEMLDAYVSLHEAGYAHSVETWIDGQLAGGLYGVAIGGVFFGESMFSHSANASKIAFAHLGKLLTHYDYRLIDCQIATDHLQGFGATGIARTDFKKLLGQYLRLPGIRGHWHLPEQVSYVPQRT